jgi:hypothetical protein
MLDSKEQKSALAIAKKADPIAEIYTFKAHIIKEEQVIKNL